MPLIKKLFFTTLLIVGFLIHAHAQVEVLEKNVLEKIQKGNSHIVVTSLDFPQSEQFLTVFKKYWTLTKSVDLISVNDLPASLVTGDSYFILQTLRLTGTSGASAIFIYLDLWLPDAKASTKKKFKVENGTELAHVILSADLGTILNGYFQSKDFGYDFDAGGHIYHWNPGILKNYLQLLTARLQTGKKDNYHDDITNKDQLKLLMGQTLYCPEDNFHKMGIFVKNGKTVDVQDVFHDYKFNYKTISDHDLGEKILNEKEPFYYLLFTRNSTSKLIAVVNSTTGEIVYERYDKGMSIPNLKSGDLKDLYKTINKN